MKIDRKEFVEVLEKVRPGIGGNVLVPEFQYFQIDGSRIQTTDGTVVITAKFPLDTGLNCSVPQEVFRLLASLDAEIVDLVVENDMLSVKTSKLEGEFAVLTPAKFKVLDTVDAEDVKLVDPELINDVVEGLGFCRFAASKDKTSGPRTGVQINGNTLFSTDRYRVLKWNLDGDTGIKSSVPIKFIDILKRYQSRISQLSCLETIKTFVAALDDDTCISTSLIDGEFPKVLKYFPDPSAEYKCVEFENNLSFAIDRHSGLLGAVDACDREMLVEARAGICTLTSQVPEKSNLVEQVDVEMVAGEEISFSVNPIFLQEITSRCSSFKYFTNGLILFETKKFRYVMRAVVTPAEKVRLAKQAEPETVN